MNDLRSAIDSIYSFIARTAEAVPGGYRWETISYTDRPQYHFDLFNGVGGIPLFLHGYHALTQEARALDLARGALAWCVDFQPEVGNFQRGVQFGKTGIAFALLHLEDPRSPADIPAFCLANAAHLLAEPVGPITDLIGGESSNGWYLLKLWERSRDERHLQGALRCASWISGQLIRDDLGTYCLVAPDGSFAEFPHAGLSHGIAGVAHFFATLYQATGAEEWKTLALELFDTLIRHAIPIHGGLNWPVRLGGDELTRCQHSHGAAGIGMVFARASTLLGEKRLLEIALQAGEATYAYGDFRSNPTLCTGLAGGGELLIELFNLTGDEIWWERAQVFARLAIDYKSMRDGFDYWPTDTPGLFSADLAYGASGTGLFLLRTLRPQKFEFPLL